jgi:hypothetical protein
MNKHAVEMAQGIMQALGDGHRARHAGQARDANPWDLFRPERESWDQAWCGADREMRRFPAPPWDEVQRELDQRLRERVEAALTAWCARGG